MRGLLKLSQLLQPQAAGLQGSRVAAATLNQCAAASLNDVTQSRPLSTPSAFGAAIPAMHLHSSSSPAIISARTVLSTHLPASVSSYTQLQGLSTSAGAYSSAGQGQGAPPGPSTEATSSAAASATASNGTGGSTSSVEAVDSSWTEVVHEATGQIYYWNQKTGQTTALGEPRPHERGRRGTGGGGSGAGAGGAGTADMGADDGPMDPRAETLLPDRTGKYAAIGALLGVFFGWAAQFF